VLLEALRISERIGVPLRDFIERSLRAVVSAMRYRTSITEVLHLVEIIDDMRKVGISLIPQTVLERMLESLDESRYRAVVEEFRSSARWFALLMKTKHGGAGIESLELILSLWFSSAAIDIVEKGDRLRVVLYMPRSGRKLLELAKEVALATAEILDLGVEAVSLEEGVLALEVGRHGLEKDSGPR